MMCYQDQHYQIIKKKRKHKRNDLLSWHAHMFSCQDQHYEIKQEKKTSRQK